MMLCFYVIMRFMTPGPVVQHSIVGSGRCTPWATGMHDDVSELCVTL